jgi:hypothetical protein
MLQSTIMMPRQRQTAEEPINNPNMPWVEKYRPARIDDISHQETTVSIL